MQAGNDVVLTFTLPQQTVDRRPLQQLPAIEIYRDFETVSGSRSSRVSRSSGNANAAGHHPRGDGGQLRRAGPHPLHRYAARGRFRAASRRRCGLLRFERESREKTFGEFECAARCASIPRSYPIGDLKAEVTRCGHRAHAGPRLRRRSPAPRRRSSCYHVYRGMPGARRGRRASGD